jgi:phosphoglycolate phosphatase
MKKCVIFDLDGTLLNSLSSIKHYADLALSKNGLPPIEKDKYKILAGFGSLSLIKGCFAYDGVTLSDDEAIKIEREYLREYNSDPCYLTTVYDGIEELLSALKEKGIAVCINSNKPNSSVVPIVKHFFGDNVFSVIAGARDGVPRKPDPTAVFEILDTLGFTVDDCIFVGDSDADMQTATNAGVFGFGALWGFRTEKELLDNGASAVSFNPLDILKYI